MCPACIVCLFESSSLIGTESTVNSPARRLQAATTEPLAFWDVGHAITLLVYRQVTHVTEQDHIAVLTLSIVADTADSIFINEGAGVRLVKQGNAERSEVNAFFCMCHR